MNIALLTFLSCASASPIVAAEVHHQNINTVKPILYPQSGHSNAQNSLASHRIVFDEVVPPVAAPAAKANPQPPVLQPQPISAQAQPSTTRTWTEWASLLMNVFSRRPPAAVPENAAPAAAADVAAPRNGPLGILRKLPFFPKPNTAVSSSTNGQLNRHLAQASNRVAVQQSRPQQADPKTYASSLTNIGIQLRETTLLAKYMLAFKFKKPQYQDGFWYTAQEKHEARLLADRIEKLIVDDAAYDHIHAPHGILRDIPSFLKPYAVRPTRAVFTEMFKFLCFAKQSKLKGWNEYAKGMQNYGVSTDPLSVSRIHAWMSHLSLNEVCRLRQIST